MNTVKLVSITEPKSEKPRIDEKISRQYYTASFSNSTNPFAKTVSRTFWQQHNADGTKAEWKGADPVQVRAFIGKTIPGNIVAANVEPYDIVGLGGEARTATTYTTVVLDGELAETVFKSSGKVMLQAALMTIGAQPVAETNPAF